MMEHIALSSSCRHSGRPEASRRLHLGIFFSAAILLIAGLCCADQQEADLVATFKAESIPVETIALDGDVVTARLNYQPGDLKNASRTEEEILILFSKIAENYPRSKRIVLDYRAGTVRINEIEVDTEIALSYAGGTKTAQELLGNARMAAQLDVEATMEEAIAPRTPKEAPPVEALPEKIIAGSERRPSQTRTTAPGGGGGGGPIGRRSDLSPWLLAGFLALLLADAALVLAFVMRRDRKKAISLRVSAGIEVRYGDGGRKTFRIRDLRTVIGRDKDNILILHDPDVSSHHAEILVTADHFVLRDLASTNGTFLNGERIHEALLYLGDEIRLGSTKLILGE
jgi:hypothetical protein